MATKIRQSQEKELTELKAHAEHAAKGTSGDAEHDKMMEQQSQSMMAKLKGASGAALDHAFLEQMAKHHEGAVAMTEGAKLQDPESKKLAQKVLTVSDRSSRSSRSNCLPTRRSSRDRPASRPEV